MKIKRTFKEDLIILDLWDRNIFDNKFPRLCAVESTFEKDTSLRSDIRPHTTKPSSFPEPLLSVDLLGTLRDFIDLIRGRIWWESE
jgi:hypothetical protein